MRRLEMQHPLTIVTILAAIGGISAVCMDPVLLSVSLIGGVLFYAVRHQGGRVAVYLTSAALFAVLALLNPLFSHNGKTVLFVVNNAPVTLEALLYGMVAACMIVAVLYWFRSLSELMTSDKWIALLSVISSKLALVLSLSLRYIPLFGQQIKRVRQAQKAVGLYKDENIMDRLRGGLRIMSTMITWVLENGIITADSMEARGYGSGRRTTYTVVRFRRSDALLLLLTALLTAATLAGLYGAGTVYYPSFSFAAWTPWRAAGYAAFCLLALLPTILEWTEAIKWRYWRSKI
ncbi:MAG: energy-coupling factor transporter transmembrane protein EcfT [Clostridia bacterium]|nr:energy-coupling factor transporter transmembrane protein EcfT [Clostridia bacterium]